MLGQKQTLFRKESLERLSSPERLDQLMQVVSPKSWLPIVAFGTLAGVAVFWSIYGRIPITVEGQGVLVYPHKVTALQSKSSGQLLELHIKVGDIVKKGQVLATLNQEDLQKQLQQQQLKQQELTSQERAVDLLQGDSTAKERYNFQLQRQYLKQRIQELETLSPSLNARNNDLVAEQLLGIEQRLREAQALAPVLQQRLEIRKRLYQQAGAVSGDEVLKAEQEYLGNQKDILELQAELKNIAVKQAEQEKHHQENLNTIADLQAQLQQIDSKEASRIQQDLEATTNRRKEIQETQREIAKLQQQLGNSSRILSPHSGRVLELSVAPGTLVNAGTRLGTIDAEDATSEIVSITYFPIADGKKIEPGMTVQVTPQTVKRQRFGGILGTVTNISQFPITKESAISEVGNIEIVDNLFSQKQGGIMQVMVRLKLDSQTFSGYQWSSSKGPQLKISSGTTSIARIKIEDRAPITFLLPFLRESSGIY
jgi:HlyD family secretion protein